MENAMPGLTFQQFEVGKKYLSTRRTITEADIVMFAGLSGDYNPLHTDETFCRETGMESRIAHGMLAMSIATGLAHQLGIFVGTTRALREMKIKYKNPVFPGDTVQLEVTIEEKKEIPKSGGGIVTCQCLLKNQDGKTVIKSTWKCMISS